MEGVIILLYLLKDASDSASSLVGEESRGVREAGPLGGVSLHSSLPESVSSSNAISCSSSFDLSFVSSSSFVRKSSRNESIRDCAIHRCLSA